MFTVKCTLFVARNANGLLTNEMGILRMFTPRQARGNLLNEAFCVWSY